MNIKRQQMVGYLRGMASEQGGVVVDIADEFEKMTNELDPDFDGNKTNKFRHHLNQAHIHAELAYGLLFEADGLKRSYFMRSAIGKAQNILITWYVRELKRKEEEE